jgi:diguanylate cyclase (GGDEF)-like protein
LKQDIRSVLAALRQCSPVVLDVPADVRYHLLQRYIDVSVRNGRLAFVSYALLLLAVAHEAPLLPRLAALALLGVITLLRARLAAAALARMDPSQPLSDTRHDLLVISAMWIWAATPFLLEAHISAPSLSVVIYAEVIMLAVLAVSFIPALPASVLATLFTVGPLVAFMLHQGTPVAAMMALGTLMFAAALQMRVRVAHRTLLQALAAERENAMLVSELEGYRRRLETENAALGSSLRDASFAASRDALTGLFNRRHLAELGKPLAAAVTEQGEAVTICVIDVDRFKRINDRHGHPVGDVVLREVARLLGTRLRDGDCLARYGGEEFVIVLRRCDVNRGRRVAEALRHNIASAEIETAAGTQPVTVSAGVAQWGAGEDLGAVIRRADAALYGAKRGGRDRVEVDARDALNLLHLGDDITITGPLH